MPFAATSMMDDENQKAQAKNGNSGVNVSGSSNTFATGVPGQGAAGGGKVTQGSGDKFANIQEYLGANKQQGDEMGQKVASNVANDAQDAQNKTSSFQSAAPTVQAYDPSSAYKNAGSLSDSDKSAYNTAKQGYQGPTTQDQVAGYSDAQSASQKAADEAKQAGTAAGQQQLLSQTYARPNYSAGQSSLDQSIMGGSQVAKQSLQDTSQKYSGLNDMFNTTANNVGAKLNTNMQTALGNQQAINTGESGAWNDLINPIQARADQYNQATPEMIDRIMSDAQDNALSPETLQALGLNNGQDLYTANLASYVTPDKTKAGLDNVATADERQKYAALQNLVSDPTRNQITAGGRGLTPISFDRKKFDSDVASQAEAAKAVPALIKPMQDRIDNLRNQFAALSGNKGFDTSDIAAQIAQLESQIDQTNKQFGIGRQITDQVQPVQGRGPTITRGK